MKEVQVSLWEMTKEEAAALPNGTQYLVYNPTFEDYKVEKSGRKSIARSKTALQSLEYYLFDDPKQVNKR